MINQQNKAKSRVGCFGASDTHFIMSNWGTATFMNWWQTKLGTKVNQFKNAATLAGTYKEHQIAKWYEESNNVKLTLDRKTKIKKLKLVVNLDAETKSEIIEIKTFRYDEKWSMPKAYWQQVQVQMFATNKHNGMVLAYGLVDDDYDNFYLPVQKDRIKIINIDYDYTWIKEQYLPRLVYLASCLKKRKTPNINDFEEKQNEKK